MYVRWQAFKTCSPYQSVNNYLQKPCLTYRGLLSELAGARNCIEQDPFCLPTYVDNSQRYLQLGYPDLAAGEAYKALLLADAVRDEGDEYHQPAVNAMNDDLDNLSSRERTIAFGDGRPRSFDENDDSGVEALVLNLYLPLVLVSLCSVSCPSVCSKSMPSATNIQADTSFSFEASSYAAASERLSISTLKLKAYTLRISSYSNFTKVFKTLLRSTTTPQ